MMLFALLGLSLTDISTEDLRKEFPILDWDVAIVEDAKERSAKASYRPVKDAMKNVIPIVVHFPDKRCVVLWRRLPTAGGNAIYCYEPNSKVLLEVYDNQQ